MTEAFLHYLWKFRLLDTVLRLESEEEIDVLHPGEHNTNAGPDFLNARIRVGNTTWAGSVEIHIKSSDWYRHSHQDDDAYSNVILHVVAENDVQVNDRSGRPLLTLVINEKFDPSIITRYEYFTGNQNRFPCESMIRDVDPFHFTNWAPSLVVERLMLRHDTLMESWSKCNSDWEEFFYRQLCRSFGFRINSDSFENLASSIPYIIIRKCRKSVTDLESLFFGQAGLIGGEDEYTAKLLSEYNYLKSKFSLVPLQPGTMKFLRLRPSNFPTIRISQLCSLLHKNEDLFDVIVHAETAKSLFSSFECAASEYWNDHFVFGKLSKSQSTSESDSSAPSSSSSSSSSKRLGDSSIRLLILNFVVPFLFFYGMMKKNDAMKERALAFLSELPPEKNNETDYWDMLGMPAENALQTQAALQLKRNYCDSKRCLECRIGSYLLR